MVTIVTWNSKKYKLNIESNINDPICYAIEKYNHYCNCNDFHNIKCPSCRKESLSFHKRYERNLIYYNGKMQNTIICIVVCKCEECSKFSGKQKYHAILPDFILPYTVYESSTVMNALDDYYNNMKIQQILERLEIRHKQFYDWIKKLNIYSFPSSIVLGINNDIKIIIESIVKQKNDFFNQFYYDYHHPFFLFKLTCVPLCFIS